MLGKNSARRRMFGASDPSTNHVLTRSVERDQLTVTFGEDFDDGIPRGLFLDYVDRVAGRQVRPLQSHRPV